MTWNLLSDAHAGFFSVVAALDDKEWQVQTPCSEWNVSQVVRHAVGDQYAFASAVTGSPGPTENQFAPAPSRPDDPNTYVRAALDASAVAFAQVGENDPSVPTPWPGSMAAELVVAACSLDCIIHAWDIAAATGRTSPLSSAFAARLLPTAAVYVEPLRAFYAAALPPEEGDDHAQTLLRFVGRDPSWSTRNSARAR